MPRRTTESGSIRRSANEININSYQGCNFEETDERAGYDSIHTRREGRRPQLFGAGRPRHKSAGRSLVVSIVVAARRQGLGFRRGNTRNEQQQVEEQRGNEDGRPPQTGG